MPEQRDISEIIEAAANNDVLTDEECLVLDIWEIIVRPEPEMATATL